jgi:2-iminoacetate synthase
MQITKNISKMTFFDIQQQYNWHETENSIYAKTAHDVEAALAKQMRTLDDFKALISPAAKPYLEQMAALSNQLTQKRFGKTIQLYIPLYLSNECTNSCVYCGFRVENKQARITLNKEQILKEVEVIKAMGFEHVLLVTGEHPTRNGCEYLLEVLKLLKTHFAQISLEVAPLTTNEYAKLANHGMHAVYIYQETYHPQNYPTYHPRGKKANMRYRLETADRLGEAGVRKIGLGCLLGLEDWRTDSFFTALHLQYLEKNYWKSKYSISFPRMRPFVGQYEPQCVVTDSDLLQLICAYRLFNQEVELSLSTREKAKFRDNVMMLGITSMSAQSKTEPGGYSNDSTELEQFAVSDNRTALEVANAIRLRAYEPVWKDWDDCLHTNTKQLVAEKLITY